MTRKVYKRMTNIPPSSVIKYRLQHGLQLIMRVQRAIINCRPCCNHDHSQYRWRLTPKHIIVQTSNPWN